MEITESVSSFSDWDLGYVERKHETFRLGDHFGWLARHLFSGEIRSKCSNSTACYDPAFAGVDIEAGLGG